MSSGSRFFCITRPELEMTNKALQAACTVRNIQFVEMSPEKFRHGEPSHLPAAGDLLYRAATDIASDRLEHILHKEGVASFYKSRDRAIQNQTIVLEKAGIPTPRTVHAISRDRNALLAQVEYLGGFPLILKMLGSEGGNGVLRVDSREALYSAVDLLGTAPILMEYIEHPVAYRLIVLGESVIAAEAYAPGPGEFRTNAAEGIVVASLPKPPAKAAEMALAAAKKLELEFGGADIIENEAGRMAILEINFPCYFADLQANTGIDVAGQMIDYLAAKVDRLSRSV